MTTATAAIALFALLSTGEIDLHEAAAMTGDVGEIAHELLSLKRDADDDGWVAVEDVTDVRETLDALWRAGVIDEPEETSDRLGDFVRVVVML